MSKICPKCRRAQKNEMHISCDNCNVPFVEGQELVATFTRDELKVIASFILKDWRAYVVAGVLLAIGACIAAWPILSHIQSHVTTFQDKTSNQIVSAYSEATNQLGKQFQNFTLEASNQIASAHASVTQQITAEFQSSNITTTVQTVASNQAKEILDTAVKPVVDSFGADAEFLRMATRARAYDFKAYLWLLSLSETTNANAQYSKEIILEIDRALQSRDAEENMPGFPHRVYVIAIGTNFDKGPFTSDEIARRFPQEQNNEYALNREGFINTARSLSQPLFLNLFVEFVKNESDLLVADHALLAISDLTKKEFRPHDFLEFTNWWSHHSGDFPEYPLKDLTNALAAFGQGRNAEAAPLFADVLKLDESADLCRAAIIISLFELGDTNKSTIFYKGFKDQNGRWQQLATAKIKLDTGNIAEGTQQLAKVAKNYPGISFPPQQGENIWRNADWQMFNKLVSATNP